MDDLFKAHREEILKAYESIMPLMCSDLKIAFEVRPDNEVDSLDKVTKFYRKYGIMPVSKSNCDNTIFKDEISNLRFRAWHDYIHILIQAEFTPEGERQVAEIQKIQIRNYFCFTSKHLLEDLVMILDIEVNGQVDYHLATGEFPANQKEFFINEYNRRIKERG